MISLRNRYRK